MVKKPVILLFAFYLNSAKIFRLYRKEKNEFRETAKGSCAKTSSAASVNSIKKKFIRIFMD